MKQGLKVAAFAIGTALAFAVGAQGRHDEKPHGPGKAAASSDQERVNPGGVGGRHDEKPHGQRKKKSAEKKKADDKSGEKK